MAFSISVLACYVRSSIGEDHALWCSSPLQAPNFKPTLARYLTGVHNIHFRMRRSGQLQRWKPSAAVFYYNDDFACRDCAEQLYRDDLRDGRNHSLSFFGHFGITTRRSDPFLHHRRN